MEAVLYGVVTASATVAGGFWMASRPLAWLTAERQATLMAMAGGLLLATLGSELLPEAAARGGAHAFTALVLGLVTVVLFERYVAPRLTFLEVGAACDHAHAHDHADDHAGCHPDPHGHHHAHALLSHGAACSALGCLLVCTFFDGVAVTASFGVSLQVGLLVGLGLLLHLLPEGMVAATVVRASGNSSATARRAVLGIGTALLAGMAFATLLGGLLGVLAVALPFAAGVLLYVVIGQLVPIALRTPRGVPVLVAMAVLFTALESLLPHLR